MGHIVPAFNPSPPDPRLAELLSGYPPTLFTQQFHRSCELADRYGLDLAIDLVRRLEIVGHLDRARTLDELNARLGFHPRFRMAFRWLLERLAAAGLLSVSENDGERAYQLPRALREAELDELRAIGQELDPANAPTIALLDAASEVYPTVARGELSGEEALFGMGQVGLWFDYFSNRNPIYAVNNRVAAVAAAARIADRPALRILELGAGAGSGTEALLEVLSERGLADRLERYLVTEPNALFRRRGQRALSARYAELPLEYAAFDIDNPWGEQASGGDRFDLIYCVNVLHVARDLPFSLGQACRLLAPEGWLVAGECLRPFPGQPVWVELIFQILDGFVGVLTDPALRPTPGFLTPAQWGRVFEHSGFERFEVTPDHARIREIYPRFFTGAVCGR